tara:strand:- start:451 stop:1059 length:609 start_codon:yes stop_codon:yes gene_type:complete
MRTVFLALMCFASSICAFAEQQKHLDFNVSLNGRDVGSHTFVVSGKADNRTVSSSMRLDFRVLLVKKVSYQHQATEVWQDGCLTEVRSETRRNGKAYSVQANAVDDGLSVTNNVGVEVIEGCVRGFAYWHPQWLQAARLLNVETGEYVPVTLSQTISPDDNITHLTITTAKADIHLEYDAAGDWLSLQTKLPLAGELRYQRY